MRRERSSVSTFMVHRKEKKSGIFLVRKSDACCKYFDNVKKSAIVV